jgi:hypothetical protein
MLKEQTKKLINAKIIKIIPIKINSKTFKGIGHVAIFPHPLNE